MDERNKVIMKNLYAKYTTDDFWLIKEEGWDKGLQSVREAQFALGNGYIGSRGILEEIPYDTQAGTYLAGVYDTLTSQVEEMVNFPNPFNFKFTANGQKLDVVAMDCLEHKRVLNMKKGILVRKTVYKDTKKRRYDYQSLRFMSMENKNLLIMQVVLTPLDGDVELDVNTGIDTSVYNTGAFTEGKKKHFRLKELGQIENSGYLLVETFGKKQVVLYRSGFYYEVAGKKKKYAKDNIFKLKLRKNKTVVFTKICYLGHTSADNKLELYKRQTLVRFRKFFKTDVNKLITGHIKAWEELWKVADLKILGTANLQQNLRFNIYHMLICGNYDNGFSSIGARTLSGEGYRGHIFWDAEIFLLPFYLFTFPEIAKNMLLYRYKRISAAKKNAKKFGYKGAMFPWESAGTGEETTPTWARNLDGSIVRIFTDKMEHHINADIAYAVYRYYIVTGDKRFMQQCGYEMIFEIAKFWASRVEYNNKKKKYEIKGVIGPDEFHENVNNNAYTNMLARWTLSTANRLYNKIESSSPTLCKRLQKKVGLSEKEVKKWNYIASRIKVNITKEKLIEEFDGYFDLQNYFWTKTDENGIPLIPRSLKARDLGKTQLVKQADVVMLLFLLGDLFSLQTKKVNYNFYIQKTVHKSSLSPSTHSIIASECGDINMAYRLFNVSLRADISNLHKNTAEGVHAASLGGTWQSVVHGFAGVNIVKDVLSVQPSIPMTWQGIQFSLLWKGNRIYFDINNELVTIKISSTKRQKIEIKVFGKKQLLYPNKFYRFEREREGKKTEEYY